jgi:hypothetical protein
MVCCVVPQDGKVSPVRRVSHERHLNPRKKMLMVMSRGKGVPFVKWRFPAKYELCSLLAVTIYFSQTVGKT